MPSAQQERHRAARLPLPRLGSGGGSVFCAVPDSEAARILDHAYDRGVRYFDTAPFYGQGLSEHRFGSALRSHPRDSFLLSTKVGRLLKPNPSAERPGKLGFEVVHDYGHDAVLRSLEDSHQRLGMPQIDIAYIHDCSPQWQGEHYEARFRQAVEGGFRALDRLRGEGTIKAIGVGVKDVDVCLRFAREADLDLIMLAGGYTLLEHDALDDLLPYCEANGIAIVLASPFNSGILATGSGGGGAYFYQPPPRTILDRVGRIEAVCGRHGVPLGAVALQFTLAHPAVTTVVAGHASPDQVDTNLAWLEWPVPAELWSELKAEGLIPGHAPTPATAGPAA